MNPSPAVDLGPDLTVQTAAGTRSRLVTALDAAVTDGRACRLDLGGVEELDSAGVQLLLVLARDAGAAGVPVVVERASAPVLDVLALLGLRDRLGVEPEQVTA